jgi:trk system potassium uptake protein TrkA
LKKLGIPQVISESNTHRHREILLRIGADRVILPKEESGIQLADELSIPGMLERLHLNQDYDLIEVRIPKKLIGKSVDDCEKYEVIPVLILRGDELVVTPDQSTLFLPEDILVLVGEKRHLAEFSNLD